MTSRPGTEVGSSAPAHFRSGTSPGERGSWRRELLSWGVIVAVVVIVALLVRTFVLATFSIPSGSMTPTLQVHDRIVVNKLSYDLHGVHRGDIIVFHPPVHTLCGVPAEEYLVKRVIGLPGDHLASKGNEVLVDGRPIAQPWLPADDPLEPAIAPTTVPGGDYFVLGDNRSDSCDSRYWGPVPGSDIVGHVVARYWPLSRIHFFF